MLRNPGAARFRAWANGEADHMTTRDESSMTEHDADPADKGDAQDERGTDEGAAQAHAPHSAPRGNPETDDEAVDKGEQNLGRVVGR